MVKDTAYYDILGVAPDVNDTDLKKAYRKKAIQYHPDKNKAADAEEVFKEVGKAYQILSDANSRAVYDKNGKDMVEKMGMGQQDPAAFFSAVFGGERFHDLIGEISLMKEMSSMADVMMTDEERAEMEKETGTATGTSTPGAAATATSPVTPTAGATASATETQAPSSSQLIPHAVTPTSQTPSIETAEKKDQTLDKKDKDHHVDKKAKPRLSPEQRKKLEELDAARKKAMEDRIVMLSKKLIERIRPFVEAKNPDDKNDPEVKAYIERITKEAEDLKLESFGVELLHTIGNIYMMKATSSLKSRKLLGIPGFFSRLKEKGAAVKEAWGLITSAVGVQAVMEDMARRQEKGEEFPEEELRAMEQDLTGKILLASWRGTRFEVSQVLREVCERVLKDPEATEDVLLKRAKAVLITGAVFKSTQADESAEEQRELERLVARAAGKAKSAKDTKDKKHHGHSHIGTAPMSPSASASATSTATPEPTTPHPEKTEGQKSWFSRKV